MLNCRRKMTKDLLERDQQKLSNPERKDWGENECSFRNLWDNIKRSNRLSGVPKGRE